MSVLAVQTGGSLQIIASRRGFRGSLGEAPGCAQLSSRPPPRARHPAKPPQTGSVAPRAQARPLPCISARIWRIPRHDEPRVRAARRSRGNLGRLDASAAPNAALDVRGRAANPVASIMASTAGCVNVQANGRSGVAPGPVARPPAAFVRFVDGPGARPALRGQSVPDRPAPARRDHGGHPHRPPPAGAGSVVNRCRGGWSAVADAPSAPWVTAYFDRRVDEMGLRHGREPLGGRAALRLGRPRRTHCSRRPDRRDGSSTRPDGELRDPVPAARWRRLAERRGPGGQAAPLHVHAGRCRRRSRPRRPRRSPGPPG